jgi:hypothetical protein
MQKDGFLGLCQVKGVASVVSIQHRLAQNAKGTDS